MYKNKCKWCECELELNSVQQFASHVSHCRSNPDYGKRKNKFNGIEKVERIDEDRICEKCGSTFHIRATKSEIRRNKVRKFCSPSCSNSNKKTDDVKNKISNSVRNSLKFQERNKEAINKRKLRIQNGLLTQKEIDVRKLDRKPMEYICQYCGEVGFDKTHRKNRKYHAECSKKCSGGIRKGSSNGISGNYNGFRCDSSYELVYLIYCLDNGIDIRRNNEYFTYEYEGKQRKYYPDFIVNDKYVEIKNYKSELTNAKIRNFPYDITVLYKEDIKFYIEYVIEKYGKDYVRLYE